MSRNYQRGTAVIKEAAESKPTSRRFTPSIYWKAGDIKTIAWLTEASEIPKVLVHTFVRVPDDSYQSGYRNENIICKKDPSMLDEFGGQCELCDDLQHKATERFLALAVELEPVKEGQKVKALKIKVNPYKNKEGVVTEYPQWGIVSQASSNFFSYYGNYAETQGDIREIGWEIHREGGGRDTKYHPYIVMNGPQAVALPDLSKLVKEIPTLDELLEEMAAPEKYAEVAGLDPDSQPTFGDDAKEESGSVPSGSRQSEFDRIRDELGSGNAY
jgi:hypothetical protein